MIALEMMAGYITCPRRNGELTHLGCGLPSMAALQFTALAAARLGLIVKCGEREQSHTARLGWRTPIELGDRRKVKPERMKREDVWGSEVGADQNKRLRARGAGRGGERGTASEKEGREEGAYLPTFVLGKLNSLTVSTKHLHLQFDVSILNVVRASVRSVRTGLSQSGEHTRDPDFISREARQLEKVSWDECYTDRMKRDARRGTNIEDNGDSLLFMINGTSNAVASFPTDAGAILHTRAVRIHSNGATGGASNGVTHKHRGGLTKPADLPACAECLPPTDLIPPRLGRRQTGKEACTRFQLRLPDLLFRFAQFRLCPPPQLHSPPNTQVIQPDQPRTTSRNHSTTSLPLTDLRQPSVWIRSPIVCFVHFVCLFGIHSRSDLALVNEILITQKKQHTLSFSQSIQHSRIDILLLVL
ncbi:hypothetical protein G7K_3829-t1 [Saitoella complicata NRRL Y-17804]|uniref:Uncharacterized protein n=1 Tax=Saitoella complicata (strain BCRC 22490 / CBS 7301 / JCM 7358 / NBRC 10748 / NRRL Y-17804) TaxID=698492 RepID=A0A0E9NIP3_SAICN|nr:hypothetical protein G7K_3829-t1 [Saitoella complicata NRRL Y-17804]